MTPKQLKELQAICNAATPGPWFWDDGNPPQVLISLYEGEPIPGFPMTVEDEGGKPMLDHCGVLTLIGYTDECLENETTEADRAFIATSRVALPALLAELDRLRAFVAAVGNPHNWIEATLHNPDCQALIWDAEGHPLDLARALLGLPSVERD